MDLKLAGQTAVVVGAARGIGQAIAGAFAPAEKANIALIDLVSERVRDGPAAQADNSECRRCPSSATSPTTWP